MNPTTREARIPAAHDRRAGDRRTGGNYDRDLDPDFSLDANLNRPAGTRRRSLARFDGRPLSH